MPNKNVPSLGDIEFLIRVMPDGFPRLWQDVATRLYVFRVQDMHKLQARDQLETYELELIARQVIKLTLELRSRLGSDGVDGEERQGAPL